MAHDDPATDGAGHGVSCRQWRASAVAPSWVEVAFHMLLRLVDGGHVSLVLTQDTQGLRSSPYARGGVCGNLIR